jgi:putative ABC transport system permease protein
MFLALRELIFARGRFSLMGGVIALIAILMVMLSGLSSGLVNDGVSGLKSMPVTAIAFDQGTKTDNAFSRSVVDDQQLIAWRGIEGVAAAEKMGVGMANATTDAGNRLTSRFSASNPGLSWNHPAPQAPDLELPRALLCLPPQRPKASSSARS